MSNDTASIHARASSLEHLQVAPGRYVARIYKRRLGYRVVRPGIPIYGAPRFSWHLTRLGALRAAQQWNELRP